MRMTPCVCVRAAWSAIARAQALDEINARAAGTLIRDVLGTRAQVRTRAGSVRVPRDGTARPAGRRRLELHAACASAACTPRAIGAGARSRMAIRCRRSTLVHVLMCRRASTAIATRGTGRRGHDNCKRKEARPPPAETLTRRPGLTLCACAPADRGPGVRVHARARASACVVCEVAGHLDLHVAGFQSRAARTIVVGKEQQRSRVLRVGEQVGLRVRIRMTT